MIPVLIGLAVGAILAFVFMLKFKDVINWFTKTIKEKGQTISPLKDEGELVPFMHRIDQGEFKKLNIGLKNKKAKYKTYKGLYNRREKRVISCAATESEKIDNELASKPKTYSPRKEIVNEMRG